MNASPMNPVLLPNIHIQPLTTLEHFERCVVLQIDVWGYSDGDVIPRRVFVVAQRIGGQVIGAFDGDTLAGFAMSLPGYRDGKPYLHSHMLAVLPQYRNAGIGRRLKLAQREDALERGINLIEWTFDPLQLKNAHFNIERLGAIVRHYIPNLYGRTSSPLHAGLPTDRLVAEWWVRSQRVEDVLASNPRSSSSPATRERIAIPADIRQICRDEPQRAEQIQSKLRAQFVSDLASGQAAVGFELDQEHGTYLLEPYED